MEVIYLWNENIDMFCGIICRCVCSGADCKEGKLFKYQATDYVTDQFVRLEKFA